ncbi:sigma-70 family RNA polymerase sigma factor [Rhodococcus sp. ACT016]|uniref:sigma-70 family RNA polymerase sigma factor n=1 Tax=Rhodococcus sp. ACT016 TaxID=3134808 RepID=UPI003D29B992
MVSIAVFETSRPQLTAIAFRLLGSIHDAEDAVQSAWIKASAVADDDLRNPAAYVTTVLTRECLDQLRTRQRRREEPLLADMLPADAVAADEHYLRRENISRALMVVLERLTPAQRVAYVLHDLFAAPFREIAETLGTSPDNAKKHASRARKRIDQNRQIPASATTDSSIVDAFLTAAADGDTTRMIALMTDDCVRVADPALIPAHTPTTVVGAPAIAQETTLFADRIRASTPMLANGRLVHIIAPGGHQLAVISITVAEGRIAQIDINRTGPLAELAMLPTTS